MAGKEEKIEPHLSNDNSESPKTLEDSIILLEEKFGKLEKGDFLAEQVIKNQINQLKDIENSYYKIKDNGITTETEDKLQILFKELGKKTKDFSGIGEDIFTIKSVISDEKNQREDTFIGRTDIIDLSKIGEVGPKEFYDRYVNFNKIGESTMRDYIEKHVKFEGVNLINKTLNKVRETDFMTKFYDILTIKYIDHIYKSNDKDILDGVHKRLNNKEGLVINEKVLNDLIRFTINDLLEKGIKPQEGIIKVSLLSGEEVKIDIMKIALEEIKKVTKHKIEVIKNNLSELNGNSTLADFQQSISLVNRLEYYINNIDGTEKDEGGIKIIQILEKELQNKSIQIMKERVIDIEKFISSIERFDDKMNSKKIIARRFEELKKIYNEVNKKILEINDNEFDINSKEKVINIKLEFKIDELEKNEFEKSLNQIISNIKKSIDTVSSKNIEESLKNINDNKSGLVEKLNKTNLLSKEEIDSYNNKLKIQEENLIEKLLYTYLKDIGKDSITDRGDMSNPELFTKLTNAVNDKVITRQIMRQIVEKGYYQAFLKEFQSKEGEKMMFNLRRYEKEWKKCFGDKLGRVVRSRSNAEDFFLLPVIESNVKSKAKSESGAMGFFQMLPGVAKDFGMKHESDLSKPKESADIAANYLEELLLENASEDKQKMISNAILMYNGNWSRRLNQVYNKDLKGTIIILSGDLNKCKSELLEGTIDLDKAIKTIEAIHKKYFKEKDNGQFHFQLLDDKRDNEIINIQYIINWIDSYSKVVLNQQYMYPEQLTAAKKAYNKLK